MRLPIPRGIVYHSLITDLVSSIKAFFVPLNNRDTIKAFEQSFAGYTRCQHAVAFPFARTAVYSALKTQNLPQGSEIIMPPITIKSMLDVVLALKLKPVFVDIDSDTLCFDLEKLAQAITPSTRAVLVTYLFGMVPDMDKLMAICKAQNLFVIEDFSQCLNGKYDGKNVGCFGDVGIYSASSIKTLDTYGGGISVTNNTQLAEDLRNEQAQLKPASRKLLISRVVTNLIRNVATGRLVFAFATFNFIRLASWLKPGSAVKHIGDRDKQMLQQLPSEWFTAYSSFQAKLGLKLLVRVEKSDAKRIANVEYIKQHSQNIHFVKGVDKATNVYWQFAVYFEQPLKMQKYLHQYKIDTSTTSLTKISDLPAYPVRATTPNADNLHNNALFVPAYPSLSQEDLKHIVKILNNLNND